MVENLKGMSSSTSSSKQPLFHRTLLAIIADCYFVFILSTLRVDLIITGVFDANL